MGGACSSWLGHNTVAGIKTTIQTCKAQSSSDTCKPMCFLSPKSVPGSFLVRKDASTLLTGADVCPVSQGLQTVPFSAASHRRRKDWYI